MIKAKILDENNAKLFIYLQSVRRAREHRIEN
jgi:hypothetical protein